MARSTNPADPCVTFWGAARSVTGSMHRVDVGNLSLLLDCGMIQGSRATSLQHNRRFPFRPKEIDAVLLSHAHLDHCGNLPNLVKQGFRGTIYCTGATRALAGVILGDSAKIQEEDAAFANRHQASGQPPVEPLYTGRDVYQTLLRLKAVPYDRPIAVGPGVEATFVNAGHLLGSAMVHLSIIGANRQRQLTFTGDLGRSGLPILPEPAPVPPADLVICESTYGGRTHESVQDTPNRLEEIVRRTVQRGGRLLVPAFSVGRTQTIIYYLHQLIHAGRLPHVPIYVDSPMAVRATEVFNAHPESFDVATRQLLEAHPELFGDRHITYVDKVHESIALNRVTEPCMIISASGMCEAGRVLHHLVRTVEDARSTILLAGYQAEGTLGRRLAEKASEVRILGRTLRVRAEVIMFDGLSHHADHAELLEHLQPLEFRSKIRLVHGEFEQSEALAAGLREAGFNDVEIPERGQRVLV